MNVYSKTMPGRLIFFLTLLIPVAWGVFFLPPGVGKACAQGIRQYYARYDLKSSRHRITDANLLMVPAENEFRAENFSYILTVIRISLTAGESDDVFVQKARERAIISTLETHGLKSVTAKDTDTVVSYEGAVITPVEILDTRCDTDQRTCVVSARVRFSPLSFPDQWERQNLGFRIKRFFKEFFGIDP